MNRVQTGTNDLQTCFPDIATEWHPTKNGTLTPNNVAKSTSRRVWWICSLGHEWEAAIAARTKQNQGCPYCSNHRVLAGFNDLATTNPELVKEWNCSKNGNIKPTMVTKGSFKKVWWICSQGHEWEARIEDRAIAKHGCPYCSGQKAYIGFNDLASSFPKLLEEWNFEKNGDLSPEKIGKGSVRKVWWRCKKGHEWQTSVVNRTANNQGCPECFTASHTSFREQAVYFYLKRDLVNETIINRKQFVINGKKCEVDIYIQELNIGIEYDGAYWHRDSKALEDDKELRLKSIGVFLLRIKEGTKNYIKDNSVYFDEKNKLFSNLEWAISQIEGKLGVVNKIIDINEDIYNILELCNFNDRKNSLAEKYPQIALEWNYKKNGTLKPIEVSYGSKIKVWWICSNGHEWSAVIKNRTLNGSRCPKCFDYINGDTHRPTCFGNRAFKGVNDLETCNPDIASEWNYEKNDDLSPSMIAASSHKIVWWICPKGHEYTASVAHRTGRNQGCSYCTGRKILSGYNDFETKFPDLATEWDYDKNINLSPSQVSYGSAKKVWWKCKNGHEFYASIHDRTAKHSGCPFCYKLRK